MKYKVGDKVRVRSDLVVDKTYGDSFYFNNDMTRWRGQIVTISEVESREACYRIKEDTRKYKWGWVDEMFEDIVENKKYKVGDKVRVREDLVHGKEYGGITFYMDGWKGKVVTISFDSCGRYEIAEDKDKWIWSDEMFEDISDDEIKTQTVDKARTVDVGYYLKFCGHRVIENVYQGVDNGKLFFTTVDGLNQYILPKDAIKWVVPHEG